MVLYIENPPGSTKKLLDPINKFSELVGYKIIYRNLLHFYMLVMNYQKEKAKKIPFKIESKNKTASKKSKILRNTFNQVF